MKKTSKGCTPALTVFAAALVAAAGSTAAYGQCTGFNITSSSGATITPGATDIGNHTDDSPTTTINLPFSVSLYGNSYSTVEAASNGNLQFTVAGSNSTAYGNECLTGSGPGQITGVAMFPHWDDLRTDGTGNGIFTSVTGVAPNRVFNIEWRAVYFNADTTPVNFEVRLYENNSHFEFVYGAVPQGGSSATVGVQGAAGTANQVLCNATGLTSGQMLTFTPINSATVLCAGGSVSPAGITNCSGGSTLMTVHVNPATSPPSTGIAVSANLTAVGGAASVAMHDDGINGDAVAGDNTFSLQVSVPSSVTPGSKALGFSASDQQGRSGAGTVNLTVNCVTPPNPVSGPDVVTFELTDVTRWGPNTTVDAGRPVGSVTAYSVGTTSSNLGDYPVLWVDGSPSHAPDYNQTEQPQISQNMYRLKSYGSYSRFEQLGQSWLKHGFVSTNSPGGLGTCINNTQVWSYSTQSYSNFGGDALGINCTDTYGSGLNGSQGNLGAKNIVNATTGYSPYILGNGTGDGVISERLQVATADVTGQPAGTRYFVDGYYCTQDDSQFVRPGETVARNALNNASWREVRASTINTTTAFTTGADYPAGTPNLSGTQRYLPGLAAWKAVDPTVTFVTADHDDYPNPGTGYRDINGNPGFPGSTIRSRYWAAAKVTPLAGGLFRYEYAVYNHNSDRSANQFVVPMPVAANVTDVTFRAPVWHSGEPYSNAQWVNKRSSTSLTFSTEPFSANANANALRWGNTFNFGFTSDVAPSTGAASLALFKPGVPGAPSAVSVAGLPVPTVPAQCGPADIGRQGGLNGQDGQLDNNDFIVMINFFFDSDGRADFGSQGGLTGADGQFDNNDFIAFINLFFAGC